MEEAVSRQSPQPPTICLMTGSNRSRSASFVSLYSARRLKTDWQAEPFWRAGHSCPCAHSL